MRPGNIHGSGRRAGPGAERIYLPLRQADPSVRRAAPAAMPGAMQVVMTGVLAGDQPQVPSASDEHPVQALAAGAAHPAANLASRSRIRNVTPSASPPRFISRLRACRATHSPAGWAVIPARCTRPVPCSMSNSTYRRRRNTVSTPKKSPGLVPEESRRDRPGMRGADRRAARGQRPLPAARRPGRAACADNHQPGRLEAACAKATAAGDPSYRTFKGILAAGTEGTPVSTPTEDGRAAAFLHSPHALFAADGNVVAMRPGTSGTAAAS